MIIMLFLLGTTSARAVVEPLSKANNKIGVHILDPNEINQVADLVNGADGDWGYVTVPLRADDKDRVKWQSFFDQCFKSHIIPIVRIATVMNSHGWDKPTLYDAVDFANFLNDLDWPTKNRYVIVYNEPNHATEWGGEVDPVDYGRILLYTSQIFKERSSNFFILPAGLDAAAPNNSQHMELYRFLTTVNNHYPEALRNIDGWTSHSYPNPAFSGKPSETHSQSIVSFKHELDYMKRLVNKDLPVFITETGWSNQSLSDETVSSFYLTAFRDVWQDEKVVAVTPFLLMAGQGPFQTFSLLQADNSPKPQYLAIKNLPKVKGQPILEQKETAQVLGEATGQTEEWQLPAQLSWNEVKWQKFLDWLILE